MVFNPCCVPKAEVTGSTASLSIASIYLTVRCHYCLLGFSFPIHDTFNLQVLSFDGTMLTFLKSTRDYSDPFIAGQRAICTAAGLAGTVLFPIVSRNIGLVRTGSWSIWLALHFS